MKKILALLLIVVMSITLLTGCGNPVYDDLTNFLNVEMVEVNANYETLKEELSKWETFESDEQVEKNINEVLLPIIEDSYAKLNEITPETEEIKEIKAKYIKVMDAYKEGFEALAEGCKTKDDATINAGSESISKAVDLLDEYNAALEAVAKEVGAEIEY